ncbi:integrase domain-containing protein [uncultured Pseudomonas sp.]|uniref:integrase domain-containing protein n=1 Tax=uncultured Pseudomonas sp. TaxID=114707 RepID=UPI0025900A6D|nr:integrase domain-containing protein [uncultured Pseudomonas sp.]
MKRGGRHDSWNFGNGRKLEYAYKCALQRMYGGGHFATVKAHSDRCRIFARWCASGIGPEIKDAREIHNPILYDYAAHLSKLVEQGEIAVNTAVNRLSSVNIGMEALRGDRHVRLPSPSEALAMQRTRVRQSVPQGQDRAQVQTIVDVLCHQDQLRAAAMVQLARASGMRLRETMLADLPRLIREADKLGKINIQDGTKGGRSGASAPRWIEVDGHTLDALRFAKDVSPKGSRNMIAPDESYANVLPRVAGASRAVLHNHAVKGFHELRAAYACERYEQITHHPAPVNGGRCYAINPRLDREARIQISYELGHGRIDVAAAYIGGRV